MHVNKLQTQITRIADPVSNPASQHSVRRVYLIDRKSGLPCELEQDYIDHVLGTKAVNSQDKAGDELGFFREWQFIQAESNPLWEDCATRALRSELPMSQREVDDFATFCNYEAKYAARYLFALRNGGSVEQSELVSTVSAGCLNGRIRTTLNFLSNLLDHGRKPQGLNDFEYYPHMAKIKSLLEASFARKLVPVPKQRSELQSLNASETKAMEEMIAHHYLFKATPAGQRDALMIRTLRETACRAGDLLKIKPEHVCGPNADFDSAYITFMREPQSADDGRTFEPALKTGGGDLPISDELFEALEQYILDLRRDAVDKRNDGIETAYLFVDHGGNRAYIGKEISQRNLNRVLKKLATNPAIRPSIHPHSLRHTGLTESADSAHLSGKDGAEIEQLLTDMGRFAPGSAQIAHYTGRHVRAMTAKHKRTLDEEIRGKTR